MIKKILALSLSLLSLQVSLASKNKLFPFQEKLLKQEKSKKLLETQMSYIRNRFYTILSINILPSKNAKTRTHVKKILKNIDRRVSLQQTFQDKCSFQYNKDCRHYLKSYLQLLLKGIELSKVSIQKTKIKYIVNTLKKYQLNLLEQYIHFNQFYAFVNISLKKVTPDHLYSTHKYLRDSIFESFNYFVRLTNQKSANQFIGFFHRFIIPTHHMISSSDNHKALMLNFESLSKTLYDFSFYMDKFAKISKKTKISANAMMSHWNQLHKYFTRR